MCQCISSAPAAPSLAPYLPMFDPDAFGDVAFFEALAAIGYRQVLLGGTGAAGLGRLSAEIRAATDVQVVLYPGGPGGVADADLVVLPEVMNSNSHFARPFGSGPVATAAAIAARGLPYLPVAYFIMAPSSTAGWFYDAGPPPNDKVMLAYAQYAAMHGFRYLALDYEDPDVPYRPALVQALARVPGLRLVVSDELTPPRAREALALGVHTVVTPSNVYEDAGDPLRLAAQMYDVLLRDRAPALAAVAS